MASKRPSRSTTVTKPSKSADMIFIENIIGLNIIVNPNYTASSESVWEVDWEEAHSAPAPFDKKAVCQWASVCFYADNEYWCVAKSDDSSQLYDISAAVMMNFEWYRNGSLKYLPGNHATFEYLKIWMTKQCQNVSKYKLKAKKIRRGAIRTMVNAQKCIAQYGAYLGFYMYNTVNKSGQKQRNKRTIKMPLLLWQKRGSRFDEMISRPWLKYRKKKVHLYCVDQIDKLSAWLVPQYILREEDGEGTYDIVQTVVSYNEENHILMVQYDVRWTDLARRSHFIYRDILSDNPNYNERRNVELAVDGFIRKYSKHIVPTVLCKLCFGYMYDEYQV
eukprot:399136_1